MSTGEQDNELENQTARADSGAAANPHDRIKVYEGRSCKGCLYYSSVLKSQSKNPTCVGIPRTLKQVPSYVIGESELEATKEGRTLRDFKYACVGYSVYLKNKDPSADNLDKATELPFCVGLEVLMDRRPASEPVPATHAHSHTDRHAAGQPQTHQQPKEFIGDEYINRFRRSASLVAAGVGKNLNRVGNYVKESFYEIVGRSK